MENVEIMIEFLIRMSRDWFVNKFRGIFNFHHHPWYLNQKPNVLQIAKVFAIDCLSSTTQGPIYLDLRIAFCPIRLQKSLKL